MVKEHEAKIVELAINQLNVAFYVRLKRNEDRVEQLADLIKNGTILDPIVVTEKTKQIVDGRHRLAAYERLEIKRIDCKLVPEMSETQLIAAAFEANCGGSLPPTNDDINHVIGLMLDKGVPITQICKTLPFPPGLVRTHVKNVSSAKNKQKLRFAVNDVADNDISIPAAAKKFGVDEKALRNEVRGKKPKGPTGTAGEMTGHLTSIGRSTSQKIAKVMMKLQELIETGEISKSQAETVIAELKKQAKNDVRKAADWEKRLRAKMANLK